MYEITGGDGGPLTEQRWVMLPASVFKRLTGE